MLKTKSKIKGHDSRAVANLFVERADIHQRPLDIMQLNKLVYLAHGWRLGRSEGRPLICHEVLAWRYGPVIRQVYGAFRPQGIDIKGLARDPTGFPWDAELDADELEGVDAVYNAYSPLSGPQLSALTHQQGTPWRLTWDRHPRCRIPNDLIQIYFSDLIQQLRRQKQ